MEDVSSAASSYISGLKVTFWRACATAAALSTRFCAACVGWWVGEFGAHGRLYLFLSTLFGPYLPFTGVRGLLHCFRLLVGAFKVRFEYVLLVCKGV